jgi:acyl transferase domain-containing protein/acyl carrier protein/thioesterase domain-containing protein/NAD(P)-dependent dehydrogenase (short-subunit alcohol dehydrogenase family)/SAM-dependent methyltransferase
MTTFKETVLRMVARKELSAAQAMSLISQVHDARANAPAVREPVAIIGMSGRFPGADSVESFWHNVRHGVNSVGELPRTRFPLDELYDADPQAPGKSYCKWGGFVDGIDEFDAAFFNISAKEAQLIDPQQRLFLEEASRALESAGLTGAQLDGLRCGVFAGVAGGDFIHQISDEGITPDAYAFMGNASSILAARISYHLNLKGPSLAIDTACSSSLVAIHLACESLALGTSELALAGGVCVLNTPNFFMAGSKAGMLSKRGACRTFDQGADGFVPAEGVGVIVLKPLSRALADGDHVLGVIEGSAINQDGRTNGITAPSAPSQTALALGVYEQFRIDPSTIGYVEAHGTGTVLGDPIEIEALSAAFRKYTDARGFCAIGSSKTNIGHAMSASGMAGMFKLLKALEAGELPPSLHFETENAAIGFAATPFRVNTKLEQWVAPAGTPRRAAISSFGFSGTNAHLVVAQAPRPVRATPAVTGELTFVLSAKSRAALQDNCLALANWLAVNPHAALDSVSWTLLTARNQYEYRAVLIAATGAALQARLRAPITATKAAIPTAASLFGDTQPPRITLPTYRFERRKHTLGTSTKPKLSRAPHPLLDEAGVHGFHSLWDRTLPFVRDHQVMGQHIVPGACLVELALAATNARRLADVVFRAPLRVGSEAATVSLELDAAGAFVIRSGAATVASGRTLSGAAAAPDVPVLENWLDRPASDITALMAGFDQAGVRLGPYCRGLHRLWLGEGEALAQLQLPAGESRSLAFYTLHPTLVDGAFQAAMALLAHTSNAVLVPASVGAIDVHAPLPAICYAHVRLTGPRSFDLVFIDESGALLASCTQFAVAELAPSAAGQHVAARPAAVTGPALRYYRPAWIKADGNRSARSVDGLTLVVRAPDVQLDIPATGPSFEVILGDRSFSAGPGQWQVDAASPSGFADLLAGLKPLERVIFLGGGESPERDLLGLLHLLQALPQAGAATLQVVVCAPAAGAALLGFAQTISREEPQLQVSVLESADPLDAWCEAPATEAGVVLAVRDGERLQRLLAEYVLASSGVSRLRRNGVYLIAGGAGGIGLALASYLLTQYGASVTLLGRSATCAGLPAGGDYIQADITDRTALAGAVAQVTRRHGAIHGVFHAAMVLRDARMRNMDAAAMRAVLAPKLAGSEALAALFSNGSASGTLDFMAFFSSANAFFGNAGQSNYAAASMGQDAIAQALQARAPFPVYVINWGFWGEVGAVASPLHRQRALEHGVGSIGVEEGLRALESCLAGAPVQLMPMKVEPATLARMGLLAPGVDDEIAAAFAAVENHGRIALRRFIGSDGRLSIPVVPRYARLRAALEDIAARPLTPDSGAIAGWAAPFAQLIDQCLAHYPAVLAGEMNPAEVLFPGGSTQWVAPLYRNNPIVDRYNSRVSQELLARVTDLLAQRARVRIVEVGAGTGGTTRGVLAALASLGAQASRIDFVFTDLSAGLVRQAKAELGPQYPFATFAVYDAGRSPSSQGMGEHDADFVLASNVLHATSNIALCLRNVRRFLRDGGVLLLNESIRVYDFSTLTFGLTDGWWLFDDVAARLPHSPLLDERLWRQALEECFDRVDIAAPEAAAPQAVFVASARAQAVPAKPLGAIADGAQLERVIHRHLAAVLNVGVADVDPERRFSELGVDSITGIDLVKRINESLGSTLAVTVLYEHSNVRMLARHVAALVTVLPAPAVPAAASAPVQASPAPGAAGLQPIAVVGLAGRFPGARNSTEFWRDLRDGVCRTGEVPADRWDVHSYYDADPAAPGKSPCKWGGFVDNIDKFDPAFFHMSGAEAEYTDPQQRLFIEQAWHALEDAGYSPDWLDGRRCGVFAGAAAGDYIQCMDAHNLKPQAFLGNGISMLASRISYLLNLRGPALSVDTACSSSLLAVHLACQSIRSGECDLALAGGVFVSSTQGFHQLTGQLGMLTPNGLCRAFDDGADGFVPGEAVAAVVLRPLDAALRDGDFIYGVIAGSGANQDGHSNGLTAPSASAQAELVAEVYQRAGIDPRTIGYVEAHGTGTAVGDPLEIEGLTRAFRRSTADRQFCAIGSAKTNIGHAGPAAGIVGLIKVLLAMQHREIPPSLHFKRANHAIDFAASPFFVAAERQAWPAGPMRAAVSAFGLSGTNVHVVLEQAPTRTPQQQGTGGEVFFPVSAMSETVLRDRVRELEDWLASDGREHDPRDIAYTLGAGRKHHAHRAIVGVVPVGPLAARYLAGEALDWSSIYPSAQHRRVPLPGYPFSRERYWVGSKASAAAPALGAVALPQQVHAFARSWVDAASSPVRAPATVALLGAGDTDLARLQALLGVPVSRDWRTSAAIALMPACFDKLESYLEIARDAGQARRVLVAHQFGEHAAVASAALHHSLRFIHPDMLWQTLETAADPVAAIARELQSAVDGAELRHHAGARAVHAVLPVALPQAAAGLRAQGVWWISGGAGHIGLQVARWLVERCQARVILTSRNAPQQELGPNIEFIGADVTDRAAMRQVLDSIKTRHGALHGVMHAAGTIEAPLLNVKSDSRAVLAPKIDGALILDDLTRDIELDAFVLFSSLSALVGDFGQCDYACANRYLESFAQWRASRRPGRTLAIHWPLWAEGGMGRARDDEQAYVVRSGFALLSTASALQVLGQALGASASVVAVACGEASQLLAAFGARGSRGVSEAAATPVRPAAAGSPAPASADALEKLVLDCTARIVRLPVDKLTRHSRFSEVGLDSLYMKDLASALGAELGIEILPTAFFEHQNVAALAAYLQPQVGASQPMNASCAAAIASAQDKGTTLNEPIAVVGISGRFPQSADVAALWEHLANGDDCVTEIPAERWDWRAYHAHTGREHDKSVSRWGGFMPGIADFDSAFFGMSPREAVFMDPQHRLFLQHAWSAFEDAGIKPSTLGGRAVGVWAGAQPNEYMRLIGDAGEARAQAALGNTQTMLANRVSYWFDLRGPSQTVDTACSSSLVAVHRAVQSLQRGECELAIAGGVSVILAPDTYVLASQLGMLSADGRCKTFDRSANGYVKGEGVGVVLLKTLARAQADGDRIYGVIRASAEGHGGKASSLTAPNPQAQAQLVADTWRRAGVPIDRVSYVEAHGTGTELGDPIEVEALTCAFQALASEQGVTLSAGACGIGSIKSNIGHLEPASGVASLIKVLLSMQHATLPATLHVKEVNPYLKLGGSPFRLVRERTSWHGDTLHAGVSAFGFGGSNAHVALESAPPRAASASAEHQCDFAATVALSAKTPAALRESVAQLCTHLENQPVRWRDLVYTLQHGREQFEHKLEVGASSVRDLLVQCRSWLGGAPLAACGKLPPVTEGRRIALPTYPFERKHTWFDQGRTPAPVAPAAPVAAVAPQPVPAAAPVVPTAPGGAGGPGGPGGPGALEVVRAILAELLYLETESITDDARFVDLGLDSILAVEFAKKLQDHYAMDLRASRLYDYASVAELAAHIDSQGEQPVAEAVTPPEPTITVQVPAPALHTASGTPALEEIRAILADLLYLEHGDIADEAPFVELGLDSILAVEFAKKLQDRYAIDLRATRLYDYSTVRELANWVDTMALGSPAPAQVSTVAAPQADAPLPAAPSTPAPAASPEVRDTDIAIVGMAARFPGARNVDAFWRNLAAGVDSVTEVPADRWSVDGLYPHKTYCRNGGFIDDVDQFDPLFFKISPQEAEWMDPQQRLFLEQAWLALEDAGLPDRVLSGTRCAVFAGAGQGDYFKLMDPESEAGAQFGIGNVSSILAGRLSYFLNLKGPAVALDTACSSSLVATHLAAQALINGEVDVAVAGGVSLMITPQMHVMTCQTRMLSPEGHCKTFDSSANGFVPGEGVGVVVLKRLKDALANGDRIHAVIRGSGTNQDGRTNGITAPSAQSQTALQVGVYERFGIDPSTITCVEAHGTGTHLGDPIEVDALTSAFRRYTDGTGFCALGSVKTNIGHTLPAAGIAGLIKGVLMLRARQIAPTLHCATENTEIDFASSPFYVNQQLQDWTPPAGVPRRVAVSSFGFSGTNAHLVLEEWRAATVTAEAAGPWSFVLSARTPDSLGRAAIELADWLELDGSAVALADIAYTLSERRGRHVHQRVVNAADRAALAARLRAIDFGSDPLLPPANGRTVSLPAYPFDRRRFWVPLEDRHPLVDSLDHAFATATAHARLPASHELLAQHVIAGTPTLPGAAYIEIALACGRRLGPKHGPAPVLRNVVWTRPFQPPEENLATRFRAEGGEIAFESAYCRGVLMFGAPVAPAPVNLQLNGGEAFSGESVYAAFSAMGLVYGESLRGIVSLRRDQSRVIAQLKVPHDVARYCLDPRVLDAALQTPIGFALGRPAGTPMVPYLLERLVQHAPLTPDCLAVATVREGDTPGFDIAIVSAQGAVLVEASGFSSLAPRGATAASDKSFFSPRWKIVPAPAARANPASHVLILHSALDHGLAAQLGRRFAGSGASTVLLGAQWRPTGYASGAGAAVEIDHRSLADWSRLAESLPELGRVFYLGALAGGPLLEAGALDRFQESAALPLVRFVRAWANAERALPELVIVTNGVMRVLEHDPILPQAASLVGLAGVISKEFPGSRIAHLDLEAQPTLPEAGLADLVAHAAPGSAAWRRGQFYTQSLEPLVLGDGPAPFRAGGVYLVVGGAGGIGGALAMHLAGAFKARIALVGRRAPDQAIEASLAAMAAAGGEGIYLRADVGDAGDMEEAREAVLARWGVLHGVIHSAVTLHDQTLARLDDQAFATTIRAKGRGTCVLAQVLRDVPLDWMLVFSSTISFTRNAGQASYTAASTLQDAVAAAFSRQLRWPVKTINWGFWGDVGVVATDRHRALARSQGVGSLTLADALDAIGCIVGSDLQQVAVLRLVDRHASTPAWQRAAAEVVLRVPLAGEHLAIGASEAQRLLPMALQRLEHCGRRLLGQQLASLDPAQVTPAYRRLVDWAHTVCVEDPAGAEAELALLRSENGVAAFAALLDASLRDFTQVVTGRKSGTEVLFPAGSASMVEAVYRDNDMVREHQRLLGSVVASIAQRPLSVLEVGAGTGASTHAIVRALDRAADGVRYHFTDISPFFVERARAAWHEWSRAGVRAEFSVLDLEQDPSAQGFAAGSYDVLIAANVLHATASMSATLQRVKKLLKRGGVLMLVEMTGQSDFSTMTFGLTEGWWRFGDPERRQPHSPLLSVVQWEGALAEAGFVATQVLGTDGTQACGQVLMVAQSDGWYADPLPLPVPVASAQAQPMVATDAVAAPLAAGSQIGAVRAVLAAVLRTLDAELVNDAPFEAYGVDSLVAIDIMHKLEPRFGALSPALLQKHNSIERLAAYLGQRAAFPAPAPQPVAHIPAPPVSAAAGSSLVTVKAEGAGPRTFWVHSVLGETDWVTRLAGHLPEQWPVHALRLPPAEPGQAVFATLEAMAASYLVQVRSVQPHGPYILGGYSFGGSVAFEMARQLVQAGAAVQALVLLDAFAPRSAALASLRATSWDGFLPRVVGALLERTRDVRLSARELAVLTEPLLATAQVCAPLLEHYEPEPCPLHTILIRNRHSFIGPASPLGLEPVSIDDSQPDHGWTAWLGAPPQIVTVDTDHFCLGLEPAIGEVARHVGAFLQPGHPGAAAVLDIVRGHVLRILPHLEAASITPAASLRELGANSLDRVEVAICTMEDLQLTFAPTELAGVNDIAGLVAVFLRHLDVRAASGVGADA